MLVRPTLIAVFAIAAVAAPAWAGEGNGEPFPPPDSGVVETPGITHYTMGADAPFNYFYTPKPTAVSNYNPTLGGAADPFPWKAAGQNVPLQPTQPTPPARSTVVAAPHSSTHG